MSGIFYSETAFPVLATEGLVLKIVLNSAMRSIRTKNVDGFVIQRDRSGRQPQARDLPMVGGYTPPINPARAGQEKQPSTNLPQTWQLVQTNGAIAALPGAGVAITSVDVAGGATALGAWSIAPNAGGLAPATTNADTRLNVGCELVATNVDATHKLCLNMVGQHLYCGLNTDETGAVGTLLDMGVITAVAAAGVNTRFTLDGSVTIDAGTPQVALPANFPPVFGCITEDFLNATSPAPNYVVSDVELVVSVVEPAGAYFDAMVSRLQSKSGLEMDIKSFNLYRSNLYQNQTKSQQLLPTTEYRARAVLQSQLNPTETFNHSAYEPLADEMSHYIYNIGNKLVPNRRVDCAREHNPDSNMWNELLDAERTKCLNASKVPVLTETHPSGRPVFGRELAKKGHSFDANTHEIRLTQDWGVRQQQGNGVGNPTVLRTVTPQYDKLLYTRVRHFRKLTMKPNNTVVSY